MDRQPVKVQPQMDIQKSMNRQQEAECSHPNKQVMIPFPDSAPEPVLRPEAETEKLKNSIKICFLLLFLLLFLLGPTLHMSHNANSVCPPCKGQEITISLE